jgi:hypothetical protein
MLSYGVYLVNGIYSIQSSIAFLYETVCDAYRPKSWIFTTRNEYPVMVSSAWTIDPTATLVYSPNNFAFFELGISDKFTLDIVTAELKTPSGVHDLSSFFYSVKWYATGPSLYELVLLYLMHERICVTTSIVNSFSLTVLTSDAEEHTIEMNSALARQSFRGFTEGLSKATTEGLKVD